jgi:hypothetical protein
LPPRKKPAAKTGAYAAPRPKTGAPRRHYLVTNVTEKEKKAISDFCAGRGISVSAFLAGLVLDEAQKKTNIQTKDEEITVTLKLSARDIDKMRIFARLEEKTIEELMQQLLQPRFQKRQTASTLEMETLRCWLSNEEHRVIKKYLARHRLSARNYLALLALRAISQG